VVLLVQVCCLIVGVLGSPEPGVGGLKVIKTRAAWRQLAVDTSVPNPVSISPVAEVQMDLHGSGLIPFSDDLRQVGVAFCLPFL
jgi:hypothetical protein